MYFGPLPTQDPFSLNISKTMEEKWNLEGGFDTPVSEPYFVNLMSCRLSLFKNVKHCVVNSLGIYITMTGKYLTEYLQCNAILYIQNLYAQNTKRGPLLHTTPHPFFSHQQPSVITPYSV
jgi:hypothetical protein